MIALPSSLLRCFSRTFTARALSDKGRKAGTSLVVNKLNSDIMATASTVDIPNFYEFDEVTSTMDKVTLLCSLVTNLNGHVFKTTASVHLISGERNNCRDAWYRKIGCCRQISKLRSGHQRQDLDIPRQQSAHHHSVSHE